MSQLLDGKLVSGKLLDRLAAEISGMPQPPILAVILVGEDPASQVYVGNKKRACARVGIVSREHLLPENAGQSALLALINQLNADENVHGILCQMPLPRGFDYDEQALCRAISPAKDVDVFHPENVGKLMLGEPDLLPCTPGGVLELLDDAGIDLAGKHVVVIGRSNIVGKPMAMLALQRNATVTICHSRTKNLPSITRQADVLVAAVGRLHFVTADMVKDGAVVVDVGINRLEGRKVRGDVDFDAVAPKCSWITPVPGGVGPMTIAILMKNTLAAAKLQKEST
ncbi:MAG: bifunctional methylenetetrahydrofolate dehydrogenase/methenyltetrahydrofolate cyclohydrolase FolD [Oscillospiraceae bacterium]|nr:bifunctional methylenetetrahydrofolate dehydrogenase/methenyltetrahydrofolate cyclohydrolase FolD [Oscillospiraceae bacterium]